MFFFWRCCAAVIVKVAGPYYCRAGRRTGLSAMVERQPATAIGRLALVPWYLGACSRRGARWEYQRQNGASMSLMPS